MITCSLGLFIKEYTLPTCSEMMYATSSNLRTSSHHTEQVIQETLWFPTFCSIFHPKKICQVLLPLSQRTKKRRMMHEVRYYTRRAEQCVVLLDSGYFNCWYYNIFLHKKCITDTTHHHRMKPDGRKDPLWCIIHMTWPVI